MSVYMYVYMCIHICRSLCRPLWRHAELTYDEVWEKEPKCAHAGEKPGICVDRMDYRSQIKALRLQVQESYPLGGLK